LSVSLNGSVCATGDTEKSDEEERVSSFAWCRSL